VYSNPADNSNQPQTQVLLWVYGDQFRAVFEHVVLAD
jgi:hypothetical protein